MNPNPIIDLVSGLPWSTLERGVAAQLARDCNLSTAAVSKWANGTSAPSPAYWNRIEDVFRLPHGTIAKAAGQDLGSRVMKAQRIVTQLDAIRSMLSELDAQMGRLQQELRQSAGVE